MPIARNHYYHPVQVGSWSLKALLPGIAPDLSYDKLEGVQGGMAASNSCAEAINPKTSDERRAEIERQLLEYCELDTFATVKIWEFFRGY